MNLNVSFEQTTKEFKPIFATATVGFFPVFGNLYKVTEADYFTGDLEYTPTEEEQTISCRNKTMPAAVVIHKIPSSYGKITYSGSRIRVE